MGATKFSTTTALALAAVVLSSSTTVFAVAKLPKHSVGAKQLKTSAVTNTKIGTHAVSNSKIGTSAVTSSKVKPNSLGSTAINESALGQVRSAANAGFALTAGNSARLENKGSADFVGAPRMAFGKGGATDVPATTVLSLPNVGVTVSTNGTADEVSLNLPLLSTISWIVAVEGKPTLSTPGGPTTIAAVATTAAAPNSITAHIWRFDNSQGIYLHCAFATTGFTTSNPLSCWAFST
jgi:hypothetical protein